MSTVVLIFVMLIGTFPEITNIPEYKNVLGLGGKWTATIFHFPSDALSSLAYLTNDIQSYRNYTIVIKRKSQYCLQWLQLLGIDDTWNIIDTKHVKAANLITLSHGGNNGASVYELEWMAAKLREVSVDDTKVLPGTPRIALIYRPIHGKRGILNHEDILQTLQNIGKVVQVPRTISENRMMSIRDQIKAYSNATIVIGSHGAGICIIL